MNFEPAISAEMYGPLLLEKALQDVPIFGPHRANVQPAIDKTLQSKPSAETLQTKRPTIPNLPPTLLKGRPIADRLRALRKAIREADVLDEDQGEPDGSAATLNSSLVDGFEHISISQGAPTSCRQLHESLLSVLPLATQLPNEAQSDIDHTMLLRAKERYLLDPMTNRTVVSDDLWLRYIWDWIAGKQTWACRKFPFYGS